MQITQDNLPQYLKQLYLTCFAQDHINVIEYAEKHQLSYVDFLIELVQREIDHRYQKRVERLLKQAKMPRQKTLKSFETQHVESLQPSRIQQLASGKFIDNLQNLLIFGNPGTGKTHLCLGLAQEWCLLGRRVFYVTAADLIQQLLKAKSELKLNTFIKKLDRFEVLIIDDISYIPCDRKETDVLFTLLSSRYEMRSIVITSNLNFGHWHQIFKDEMTTQAAIDRLVHHGIIVELNGESYRVKTAKENKNKDKNNNKKNENKMEVKN